MTATDPLLEQPSEGERGAGRPQTAPPPADPEQGAGAAPPADTAPPSPADTAPRVHPPLRRSKDDRVIAGVAGGLARYLGIDPVIVRIALVVFALSGGAGVLLYLIAWIAIPEEREGEIADDATAADRNNGVILLGAILLVAGGLLLADRLIPAFSAFVGPLVLVGLGVVLMLGARR